MSRSTIMQKIEMQQKFVQDVTRKRNQRASSAGCNGSSQPVTRYS